ncbi:MAG: ABC-F family ATP-binding cassette domain-containing protein [Puniceicoccales bacterium]|jgi:ATP-binding cassette subfamily F protein 3|nr:ABC-F family ATP-binding cassette domain-containing protein [Puniceicoccales bacterium]
MINIKNLIFRLGSRVLFDDVTISIPDNSKVGVVGHNGCGKTTLFRLILGKESLDGGEIIIPNKQKVVTVHQELQDKNQTVLDLVLSSNAQLINLKAMIDNEEDGNTLAELYEQFEAIDGFSAESQASAILAGLGFSSNDMNKPLSKFSGGWQVRAALAATLFAPSDTLLLDEPTNHLDFETCAWLKNYLCKLNKSILVISHERDLLNSLCDKILHVSNSSIKLYSGNYDSFEETRTRRLQELSKNIEKQETSRKHLQAFVDRFRYKASKAKQAQSRIKMLEKMETLPKIPPERSTKFEFPQPSVVDRLLVQVKGCNLGYDSKIVIRDVNLKIDIADRIAILGANGNGKSTLVKLIANRLKPMAGSIEFARGLKSAYFSQQQTDELQLDKTPYETLSSVLSGENEQSIRSQLARFGLTQQRADTKVSKLSGGEKTRLLLSVITRNSPHILILDEPTNHLDIEARKALIDAINKYTGTLLLVTHDFHTIEATCDQLLIVKDNLCKPFDGDLNDYIDHILRDQKDQSSVRKKTEKSQRNNDRLSTKDEKKLKELEAEMEIYNLKKSELETALYANYSSEIFEKLTDVEKNLSNLETEWLRLHQKKQ